MREITDKKIKCQNQLLFTSHRPKIIFTITCFRSLLPIQIKDFCKINFLKNFKIADKSSVRKLRVSYLPLSGENTK